MKKLEFKKIIKERYIFQLKRYDKKVYFSLTPSFDNTRLNLTYN